VAPAPGLPPLPDDGPSFAPAGAAETSVRVDVGVLDKLMDLVGELVLARSRIGALAALDDDGPLAGPYRDLRVVSADLQDSVMTARLQPVGTVLGKFHRIARDLATALGKQVHVELTGEDVGVDKAVNEALRDPLLHLVRNAVDHGIEPPDERRGRRQAAGPGCSPSPPPTRAAGCTSEVADDGGASPLGAARQGRRLGAAHPEQADAMTRAEALELMFEAGLSPATRSRGTSGRGVGMDGRARVAGAGRRQRRRHQRARARVRFRLNIPLTLAIMPVLVVTCDGERYAVPQVHLREVAVLQPEQVAQQVDVVEGARLLRLRGRLLPLVDLADRLHVGSRRSDGSLAIVLLETEGALRPARGRRRGRRGRGRQAVARLLRGIPVFTGTHRAGGRAAGVDPRRAGARERGRDHRRGRGTTPRTGSRHPPPAGCCLLATGLDGGRLAVRLSSVVRLESLAPERVERSGALDVVQYGDALLPLARVPTCCPSAGRSSGRRGSPPRSTASRRSSARPAPGWSASWCGPSTTWWTSRRAPPAGQQTRRAGVPGGRGPRRRAARRGRAGARRGRGRAPVSSDRLCTFAVAGLRLGIPVGDVVEVVRGEQVTPVPLAPAAVAGVLNLRGRIVPVLDARLRLGLPARSLAEELRTCRARRARRARQPARRPRGRRRAGRPAGPAGRSRDGGSAHP
jgi:two-component system chemotaxis sensor kinase CheA